MARLKSAIEYLQPFGWEVRGLEICASDAVYEWEQLNSSNIVDTLFPEAHYENLAKRDIKSKIGWYLGRSGCNAIAVSGWGTPDARECMGLAKKLGVHSILMSETRYADEKRFWLKEFFKARIISGYDAAIVGANSHADYLVKLGFNRSNISFGYNVVDNEYFYNKTKHIVTSVSPRFFLASNRFVARKNLINVVRAYSQCVTQSDSFWNLCLLGDGPQFSQVVSVAEDLGLSVVKEAPWSLERTDGPTLFLPGFRQVEDLPEFYARASAFIHPAYNEPWGLVINEAMACGLPILSSKNVGAAEELVKHEINGLLFEPDDLDSITNAMVSLVELPSSKLQEWGAASRCLLAQIAPTDAFGEGLGKLLLSGKGTAAANGRSA